MKTTGKAQTAALNALNQYAPAGARLAVTVSRSLGNADRYSVSYRVDMADGSNLPAYRTLSGSAAGPYRAQTDLWAHTYKTEEAAQKVAAALRAHFAGLAPK